MLTLFHHCMCAPSRAIRLCLNEYNIATNLLEEYEWEKRPEFLALNPAGRLPVLILEKDGVLCGASAICEYIDETHGFLLVDRPLFFQDPIQRAEVRRLLDWFFNKFENEITYPLVRERVYKREMPLALGGGSPNSDFLRKARANIKLHLHYLNWLIAQRDWLCGERISYADLAGAATLSVLDYLAEIPWDSYPELQEWYRRLKSRPSFRPLLRDRVRGIAPPVHYMNLDF